MSIGTRITITKATNSTLNNLTGTIIDETKRTITIDTQKGPKTIIRSHIITTEELP